MACAPSLAPRGVASARPHLTAEAFVTRDGLSLPLRRWEAAKPVAVLVALHGMSDYSEAYDMPGPWFAAHGVTVLAYDQRGFGAAPDPGIWAGGDAMRQDLADCVAAARARYPGLPVFAIGESMGGAVVLSSLADHDPPQITGAILAAPAVWSRADMPVSYRVALWLSAHLVPWLHVSGNGLHIIPSDNYPMLVKLSRDPLFQHDARADQVYGLVNLMDAARHAPEHLPKDAPPILFLTGDHDQIIPKPPTEATIAALKDDLGSRITADHIANGYHMLLRDHDREVVWQTISIWIDALSLTEAEKPLMNQRADKVTAFR